MIGTTSERGRAPASLSFSVVLAVLIALTAARIVGLWFSTVDLYFDEAQYWAWSRELALGYFSKPPLLAWLIAASDSICGSGEACFRAVSPMFYLATSLVLYAIADALYDRTVAGWTALACALGTGVAFSSRIISTDVPLLFFWAVALLAYIKLLPAPDWRWASLFGLAFGVGMLAKYAMIYFMLCAISAALIDREARAVLMRPQTWAALLIAAVIFSPNIYWNVANGFVTLKHTGGNITGDKMRFQPKDMFDFAAAQFAVAGPVVFGTFLVLLTRMFGPLVERRDRLMLAFAIPVLGLITSLAAFRPANANWAAPSILSMIVVAVAWWVRHGQKQAIYATIAIGVLAQALLLVGDAYAYRISIPVNGRNVDVYKRTLGWREFGRHAADLARTNHAPTVAAEGRGEVAELIYDLRHEPMRVLSWPESKVPEHQFDLTRALDDVAAEPIVFISPCPVMSRLKRFYGGVESLGPLDISTGPTTGRHYQAFKLSERQQPIEPLGPCVEPPAR
jgi:4-amino-4-deoxy-L-arabinose transferase-like glycosyltransferase